MDVTSSPASSGATLMIGKVRAMSLALGSQAPVGFAQLSKCEWPAAFFLRNSSYMISYRRSNAEASARHARAGPGPAQAHYPAKIALVPGPMTELQMRIALSRDGTVPHCPA